MLSCSGHKFNGPKGIGFLFLKKGIEIKPLLDGGQQENNKRAGTENIPLIVGMTTALEEHINSFSKNNPYINSLRSTIIERLNTTKFKFRINGSEKHVPGILSISFKNVEGEVLLHRLDLKGICISTGSACDSKNTNLSHVLQAINCEKDYAFGTIRISISERNTFEEINIFIETLIDILSKL